MTLPAPRLRLQFPPGRRAPGRQSGPLFPPCALYIGGACFSLSRCSSSKGVTRRVWPARRSNSTWRASRSCFAGAYDEPFDPASVAHLGLPPVSHPGAAVLAASARTDTPRRSCPSPAAGPASAYVEPD